MSEQLRWRCVDCGYEVVGEEQPDSCEECGGYEFEEVE